MKRHDRQLIALSIFHAINDGSLAVFLAALPVMRITLNLSLIQIGTLLSVGLLATVVTQFVFGYLSDIGFTHAILTGGLLSLAVVDVAFIHASDYWLVLLLYLLLRAAAGVYHPVSFSTIFRTAVNRSAAMGFQSAFGDGSLAFAMLSTGFLAESFGWQAPFLIWGLAGLFGFVAFLSIVGVRREVSSLGQPSKDTAEMNPSSETTRRYVVLQFSTLFLQCLFLTFTGFMPLFLNINLKLTPGVSALVVAFWLGLGVVSSFNAGRFVEFFGDEQRTLRISFALTTLLLIAATALLFRSEMLIPAVLLLVLSGIPYFLAFPVLYGIVGTTAPTRRLGLAYATNLSFSLVAGSAISYGTGYLASIFSLIVVLPILVGVALAASLTSFFL